MEHKVNSGIWGTMFGVPYVVADNFLKLASGGQIKVLLYILRSSGRGLTNEEIAASTGVTPAEAADAVAFWEQANVLTPASGEAAPVQGLMTPPSPEPEEVPAKEAPQAAAKPQSSKRQNLSSSEIAELINGSQDISELFTIAETILGIVNPAMQNSLIWMYTYLGLKKEVIITLISYCRDIDKASPKYIETIAVNWAESEINTLEAAQEDVQRMNAAQDFEGKIMKTFEMKRRPTTAQSAFIREWQRLGIAIDIIHYAFEKCVENTDKLSFSYINKVLRSWKDSGYKTAEDVKAAEKEYRSRKAAASGTSGDSDLSKYEQLINKY